MIEVEVLVIVSLVYLFLGLLSGILLGVVIAQLFPSLVRN